MNKRRTTFKISIIIVFAVLMFTLGLGSFLPIIALEPEKYPSHFSEVKDKIVNGKSEKESHKGTNELVSSNNSNNKVVILTFHDSIYDSESTYVKPILDSYAFKATFFEICTRMSDRGWKLVTDLKNDGMDIESHTMTHPMLDKLSESQLDYEVAQSKQCFLDHGINTTIFAYPFGHGSDNATVLDTVAKNYYLATTAVYDAPPLARLLCDVCKSADDGTSTRADRYAINSWVHKHIEGDWNWLTNTCASGTCHLYDNSQMLERFIEYVNSQNSYNEDGKIGAIPIVVYHGIINDTDVTNSKNPNETTVNLFKDEMKYLHDNGFRVLTMADLGYDENDKVLYIKGSR
jgi:peptidoglycan/xylan/chitin deacetylase (PgdA/CDA1 family)